MFRTTSIHTEVKEEKGARIGAMADRTDATFVDSTLEFSPYEFADDFVVFPGDLHPNGQAHRRYTEALARKIVLQ